MESLTTGPELENSQGQQQSSNDVCVTSAFTPTAARKRTYRHFAFVPRTDVASAPAMAQTLSKTGFNLNAPVC